MDVHDNKKKQSLDQYEGEGKGEGVKYIFFLFITLFPF